MKERDSFSFRPQTGMLVYESDVSVPASLHGGVQIIDREADMVDARPALFQELSDRRVRLVCLEEFNQGVTGDKPADPGTIAIAKLSFRHSKNIAIE
jgi:hypothetical protein